MRKIMTALPLVVPLCGLAALLATRAAHAQTMIGPTTLTVEDALRAHGDWIVTRDRGPVWYPRANPGWAPNRDGRWSWVEPTGWVWIDAAPWGGILPQGGQWQEIDRRWAWVPGSAPGTTTIPVGPGQRSHGLLAPTQPQLAPMPSVVRPETRVVPSPVAPSLAPPPGTTQGITPPPASRPAPPVVRAPNMPPSPPVIGVPARPWMGPTIQRPEDVPPPTRTVVPPQSPPRGTADSPGGQGGPMPYPWGGGAVVQPPPAQYRTVPVR